MKLCFFFIIIIRHIFCCSSPIYFVFFLQYFKYVFPADVDSVIVKVSSTTAFPCSVISVQDILVGTYNNKLFG